MFRPLFLQILIREKIMTKLRIMQIHKMLSCPLKNLVVKGPAIIVMEAHVIKRKHQERSHIKIIQMKIRVVTRMCLLPTMIIFVGQSKIWNQEMKKYIVKRITRKVEVGNAMDLYFIAVVRTIHHSVTTNSVSQCLNHQGAFTQHQTKTTLQHILRQQKCQSRLQT